jgi:hypothetical protein
VKVIASRSATIAKVKSLVSVKLLSQPNMFEKNMFHGGEKDVHII